MLNSPRNIRDLASRLDDVLGHLTASCGQPPNPNTDSERHSPTSPQIPFYTDTGYSDDEQVIVDTHCSAQPGTRRNSLYRENWADRLGLDRWLLGHLLRRYRTMQHRFPFVVIGEAWDVQYMLASRPVLLLAVISSSACQYPRIQQVLIKDLKDILSRRVKIGGENSLELLQALLVHLAW